MLKTKIMNVLRAGFQVTFVLIAGISIGLFANGTLVHLQNPVGCSSPGNANASPGEELKTQQKSPRIPAKKRALAGKAV